MGMKYYLIYLLTRDDGPQYVGTTDTDNFKNRMQQHKQSDRFNGHAFECQIVAQDPNISIHDLEESYIELLDTFENGLNSSKDGKGNHHAPNFTTREMKHSEETKKKMSDAKKGKPTWNKGKTGCFSDETLKQMSEQRKGIRHSSKLTGVQVKHIRDLYTMQPAIAGVREVQRNGRRMSYVQAFCKKYANDYNITPACMKRVVLHETWK
jgi:hypothetical protein